MTQYILSRFDRGSIRLQQRCECPSEGMPANMLADSSTYRSGTNYFPQQAVRPVRLTPIHVGTAEKEIRVLVVRASSTPIEQFACKSCVHRHGLPAGLGFETADHLVNDSPTWTYHHRVKVNIRPLECQQLAASIVRILFRSRMRQFSVRDVAMQRSVSSSSPSTILPEQRSVTFGGTAWISILNMIPS
jgi:hypothetical protein